jgi:hypothetical protein
MYHSSLYYCFSDKLQSLKIIKTFQLLKYSGADVDTLVKKSIPLLSGLLCKDYVRLQRLRETVMIRLELILDQLLSKL